MYCQKRAPGHFLFTQDSCTDDCNLNFCRGAKNVAFLFFLQWTTKGGTNAGSAGTVSEKEYSILCRNLADCVCAQSGKAVVCCNAQPKKHCFCPDVYMYSICCEYYCLLYCRLWSCVTFQVVHVESKIVFCIQWKLYWISHNVEKPLVFAEVKGDSSENINTWA